MRALQFLFLFIFCFSGQAAECDLKSPLEIFKPKFAKNFYIDYYKKFKIVHVGKDQYFLSSSAKLDCEISLPQIITPAKKVVMMSTTYLPALELIHQERSLIGFQGKRYIVSSAFDLEKIQEVSFKFNAEDLLNFKADLIMGYDSNLLSPKQLQVFNSLKLPVVINRDFEETTPLGRAEWLIFISSFYNEEKEAQEIFNLISSDYLKMKNANSKFYPKPNVLIGEIQNGQWITNGAESDLGQMINDAGAQMLLAKPSATTQRISLEELGQLKMPVDFWLTHNMWSSHKDLLAAQRKDSRYMLISAKNIYNNNLIQNKNGSNDYWETGMQRPDLLLRDLSAIFHPEYYKSHQLRWYKKL